jgi:hypothetical protein
MLTSNRKTALLILALAISYFVYNTYWLIKSVSWLLNYISAPSYEPPTGLLFTNINSISVVYLMDFLAFLGLAVRFIGGFFALTCAYLIVKDIGNPAFVKKTICPLLVCEAIYFLSLTPSIVFLLSFSALSPLTNFLLSAQLIVEAVLIPPFLIALAIKVKRYDKLSNKQSLIKWTGALFLSYEMGLWVVYLLKWGELFNGANVTFSNVLTWLLINNRLLSLLNTTVILSLAVIFGILGTKSLITKSNNCKAIRYWGLSATFLGLFFIFYVLYIVYLGVLWVIPFGEIWMIPFFAIGIYALAVKDRNKY